MFTKIKVYVSPYSADRVVLFTDKPCPFVTKFLPSQPPLQLEFVASSGCGVEYVREHFGIEPEIVRQQ